MATDPLSDKYFGVDPGNYQPGSLAWLDCVNANLKHWLIDGDPRMQVAWEELDYIRNFPKRLNEYRKEQVEAGNMEREVAVWLIANEYRLLAKDAYDQIQREIGPRGLSCAESQSHYSERVMVAELKRLAAEGDEYCAEALQVIEKEESTSLGFIKLVSNACNANLAADAKQMSGLEVESISLCDTSLSNLKFEFGTGNGT